MTFSAAPNPVHVNIVGSGVYKDRLHGESFIFSSDSLKRLFQYRIDKDGQTHIVVDGKIADEEEYAYFQPTPFSEWEIELPTEIKQGARSQFVNKNLDLSNVVAIKMVG